MNCSIRTALLAGCVATVALTSVAARGARSQPDAVLLNDDVKFVIGANGRTRHFIDRRTGNDYCKPSPFASVYRDGKRHDATAVSYKDGRLAMRFGTSGVGAVCKVTLNKRYLVFEVVSTSGERVDTFRFLNISLDYKGRPEEPFTACALALNLKTNVPGLPSPMTHLRAMCYRRFGFAGATVAVVACPQAQRRQVIKDVVLGAPAIPRSTIGGPWALDAPINRGSYLFCGGGVSEKTVDRYIRLARRMGITQLNLYAARYGDWQPYPSVYPRGRASLKAVIDRIHAAGMVAGLHTYSQFINRGCPYVTPKPDPRLGKDATFTLGAALTKTGTTVPVAESTAKMSAITGFFVRNSVTLQIDDELVTYTGVSKEAPYVFTGCKRGAYGTRVAEHAKGAKVHHLRQCFHLFVADGESTLYTEVAAGLADLVNECGFDMMYLDALDGSDAVAGGPWAWHYAGKFVFELCRRLKRPLLLEASTFPHHFWYVRSRTGAADHPTRSHKKFIDDHVRGNRHAARMFLPTQLGWWAFKTWTGAQGEPTFPDDIEYLCAKALGTDTGLSIQGITPYNIDSTPALPRLAAILRRYENLRHANYFTDAVKERLRAPGKEFTLFQTPEGEWQFRQVRYDKHKVQGMDGWSNVWTVTNTFGRQPLQLRIEALMSAKPYDDPNGVTLADLNDAKALPLRAAERGVSAKLEPSTAQVKIGKGSGRLTAANALATRRRTWARFGKKFAPAINLSGQQALGVWVHGDGKGEVLNLQVNSPYYITRAWGDHYIIVDFKGWRYVELVEPEGERHAHYSWPYGGWYQIYRESVRYSAIEAFTLYYNNIPPKGSVTCYLSPVRALATVSAKLRNPTVTIGGKTIVFPVALSSGSYLEFRSPTDCKLYGPKGELLADVKPTGEAPVLEPGENRVTFTCECAGNVRPRAKVSVISHGEVVRGRNADDRIKWDLLRTEIDPPRAVCALDGVANEWDVVCRANAKRIALEVEVTAGKVARPGAAYNRPDAIVLETFNTLDGFANTPENKYVQYVVSGSRRGFATSDGVTHRLAIARDTVKVGRSSARYVATSTRGSGWSARGKRFSPPLDLSSCTDIGFWLHGDGLGEILYLQLRDVNGAFHDMKTRIDYTGWKYVEFGLTGAVADLRRIEYVIIYYNAIPAGRTVSCCIDDVRALRTDARLVNPTLAIAGRKLVFPVSLAPGHRLVYREGADCNVFTGGGASKAVTPRGTAPRLRPGRNRVRIGLAGSRPDAFRMCVQVTKVYRQGGGRP